MWKLRIEDDQSNRTVVNLVRKQYEIGRAEDNAVRLTERNVSRKHALLERVNDTWLLTDSGSYNGTLINDQLVHGQAVLGHNTRIRIGDYNILLFDSTLGEAPDESRYLALTEPAPADHAASLVSRLVVLEGPNIGTEYPLAERRLLIGRGEECDIALNDTSVSRVHADIEPDEGGRYRINDQQSSNGVRVNGVDVQSTTLYSGDIIELGDVQLQYVPQGQPFTKSDHPQAVLASVKHGGFGHLSRAQRWAAIGVGLACLGTVLAWGLAETPSTPQHPLKGSPATEALELARTEFQRGNIDAAHAAVQVIRGESNLRNTKLFRQIEEAWADRQLKLADTVQDVQSRRQILGAVASSESVESTRRKEASDRLALLGAQDPSKLPLQPGADAGAGKHGGKGDKRASKLTAQDQKKRGKPSKPPRAGQPLEQSPPSNAPVLDPKALDVSEDLPGDPARKPSPSVTSSSP